MSPAPSHDCPQLNGPLAFTLKFAAYHLPYGLQKAWVVPWALIFGAVGIFIWGLDISEWFIPATSLVLSVSFLVGPVPSQMMVGCMYALVTRPFDIGDRIRLARPGFKVGHDSPLHEMVVKQQVHRPPQPPLLRSASTFRDAASGRLWLCAQDLMHTYLLTQTGETMAIENHILRNLLVTNITRSGPVTLKLRIQVCQNMAHPSLCCQWRSNRRTISHAHPSCD